MALFDQLKMCVVFVGVIVSSCAHVGGSWMLLLQWEAAFAQQRQRQSRDNNNLLLLISSIAKAIINFVGIYNLFNGSKFIKFHLGSSYYFNSHSQNFLL